MNIANILKHAPSGTKLYSSMVGECEFTRVDEFDNIRIVSDDHILWLDSEGRFNKNGECVIFPSNGNRNWKNFLLDPFHKGDVITTELGFIAIFSHYKSNNTIVYHCILSKVTNELKIKMDVGIGYHKNCKLASDEQKKCIYNKLMDEGYFYNSTTNKLDRYKFKVGDIVKHDDGSLYEIESININSYTLKSVNNNRIRTINCSSQYRYELITDK